MFPLQRASPFSGPEVGVEVPQHDVQVVETTEASLQSAYRSGKGTERFPVETGPHLGQMTEPADLDPEAMQPRGTGTSAGASVRRPNLVGPFSLLPVQHRR